jgi:hypothetical protein
MIRVIARARACVCVCVCVFRHIGTLVTLRHTPSFSRSILSYLSSRSTHRSDSRPSPIRASVLHRVTRLLYHAASYHTYPHAQPTGQIQGLDVCVLLCYTASHVFFITRHLIIRILTLTPQVRFKTFTYTCFCVKTD